MAPARLDTLEGDLNMNTIIYTRYSSDMQRPDSCADQERNIREYLKRNEIDVQNVEMLKDEAISGTKETREMYTAIVRRIEAGEEFLLIVDDQSRFSRADMAKALIRNLVYNGGRFISVGEGIDTNQIGWEVRVGLSEIHNSLTIADLGRRVHRGQEGRILDGNGSAGDLAYGYRSEFIDPSGAEYDGRGPRPRKKVIVHEEEGEIIRQVFDWFVLGKSISWIARELTKMNISKGRKSSKPNTAWHHYQIARMLVNQKYIGIWEWGKTRTRRNSSGRKRQDPVKPEEIVRSERPSLRIVNQEIWERAQQRIHLLRKTYGYKPSHKRRGAKRNWHAEFPSHILSNVLICGLCGGRMNMETGSKYRYLSCANHRLGTCAQIIRVPKPKAEEAIMNALQQHLSVEPTWYEAIRKSLQLRLADLNKRLPVELEQKNQRRLKLEKVLANLTEAIAEKGVQSDAVVNRLSETESELKAITQAIEQNQARLACNVTMPSESWIQEQMLLLADFVHGEVSQVAHLLKRLIGKIIVEEVPLIGKKRGYPRIRFRLAPISILREVLRNHDESVSQMLPDSQPDEGEEIVIDLGAPTRMDKLAPEIAVMRVQGLSWRKIGKLTGIGRGNAFTAWKRWHDAQIENAA
jgi:hypothetical protein